MRSEFEKLSQIESHLHNVIFDEGSNKYLTKKMGYLPFEFSEWFLNGSWLIYRHQQSKIDALTLQVAEMNSRLNDAYTDGQSAMYTARQTEVDELQKIVDEVKGLAQTLWEKSEDKHQQGKVWESKTLGECADEILDVLEQVIRGGE